MGPLAPPPPWTSFETPSWLHRFGFLPPNNFRQGSSEQAVRIIIDSKDLSPAIDAGSFCIGATDLPTVPNAPSSNGCNIGACEFPLVRTLEPIEIPVRWCAVEGSPSFDLASPSVQEDVNQVLAELEQATSNIYDPQTRIRFLPAATSQIPNFPILPDPDTTVGSPGDVKLDPARGTSRSSCNSSRTAGPRGKRSIRGSSGSRRSTCDCARGELCGGTGLLPAPRNCSSSRRFCPTARPIPRSSRAT